MATIFYLDDTGILFEATLVVEGAPMNLAAATMLQFWFCRPDGHVLKKTATLSTNGTDGKMRYTTVANDLTHAGVWQWQPYVVLPSGRMHGAIQTFTVLRNLA